MKSILALLFILSFNARAEEDLLPKLTVSRKSGGVAIAHENDFLMKIRFRMQNRFTAETKDQNKLDLKTADFAIRRLRLRFDGFLMNPDLLYRIQLSFTRADQDWDNAKVPNIMRDAVLGWRWNPKHTLWAGVTKLPGNRQRVISSGSQQFVDRSLVSNTFNIDRDTGVQHYSQFGDSKPVWLKLAASNGEGRNQTNKNASLATTARLEWLPLGNFIDEGDMYEADLARELEPKLALGVTHSANQQTSRTAGQLGTDLPTGEFRSVESRFADALFKYRGWSLYGEWAKRTGANPLVSGSQFIYVGEGLNLQGGYIFENNWEPSLRWSRINPESKIESRTQEQRHYTACISKYLKNHEIKLQSDLTYQELLANSSLKNGANWMLRVQFQIGI